MTNFNIEIVSDTVCPWCYVGHKKLQSAISEYKSTHPDRSSDTFTTTWKPFYLNPASPKISVDKAEMFASKFGRERSEAIFQRLSSVGQSVGIDFKFGGKTGNTRDSHRLIQLGKRKGPEVQTRVVEELFRRYFEEERDITDVNMLVEAAGKAGIEGKEAREWLEGEGGGKEVDREVDEARDEGVSGVPHFTINRKFEVEGAQDKGAFVRLFERVVQQEEGAKA
ncbi:thioredoxin-like protein [Tothia fuscella]|uniref:Thioredoxin-like protein n=1 Tax=Tothia fuscella TaxID=1048955 RepID=A0A9P4NIK8_9PEZI|nr:thioredoxin-like protein [Tothia fuscella]